MIDSIPRKTAVWITLAGASLIPHSTLGQTSGAGSTSRPSTTQMSQARQRILRYNLPARGTPEDTLIGGATGHSSAEASTAESRPFAAATPNWVLRGRYNAKPRGAPEGRQLGGARGRETGEIQLAALVPPDTGLTTRASPSLFWYLSIRGSGTSVGHSSVEYPIEFALTRGDDIDPVLELRLEDDGEAGIRRIDLAKHGVQLETGVPYEWVVALVRDEHRRSRDVVASGTIQRVAAPAALAAKLEQAGGEPEKAAVYASWEWDAPPFQGQGIWYDAAETAIDHLSDDWATGMLSRWLLQVGITDRGALTPSDGAATERTSKR